MCFACLCVMKFYANQRLHLAVKQLHEVIFVKFIPLKSEKQNQLELSRGRARLLLCKGVTEARREKTVAIPTRLGAAVQ